jgi:hypothetical protein
MRRGGATGAQLWVLRGNARAERFYRTHGWRPDGQQRTDTIWGITGDEDRYRVTLTG